MSCNAYSIGIANIVLTLMPSTSTTLQDSSTVVVSTTFIRQSRLANPSNEDAHGDDDYIHAKRMKEECR